LVGFFNSISKSKDELYLHTKSKNPIGEWGDFFSLENPTKVLWEKNALGEFSNIMTVIWDKLSCKIFYGINNPNCTCNAWD
jgi:hypothetical protein